jgi:membrane protein implicated in regulation of membrane protease activity
MNKIVLRFGLLVFFIAIIFFGQKGLPVIDILVRAFSIFVIVSIMLGMLSVSFIRAVNRTSQNKQNSISDKVMRAEQNE